MSYYYYFGATNLLRSMESINVNDSTVYIVLCLNNNELPNESVRAFDQSTASSAYIKCGVVQRANIIFRTLQRTMFSIDW